MATNSASILWFRRDLRLRDNPALCAAAKNGGRVIPLYIHAPDEDSPWEPGAASRWWLHHSLTALKESLSEKGLDLVVRQGGSLEVLRALSKELNAGSVFWNRLYEPATISRDTEIKEQLTADGVDVQSFNSLLLQEPWQVKNGAGKPYQVFTPFWKALRKQYQHQPPRQIPRNLSGQERQRRNRLD